MALELTKVKRTVFGDVRIYMCRATFNGVTSGTVDTGLPDIDNLQKTNLTDDSTAVVSDVTSTAGSVAFTSVDSGDVIDILAVWHG